MFYSTSQQIQLYITIMLIIKQEKKIIKYKCKHFTSTILSLYFHFSKLSYIISLAIICTIRIITYIIIITQFAGDKITIKTAEIPNNTMCSFRVRHTKRLGRRVNKNIVWICWEFVILASMNSQPENVRPTSPFGNASWLSKLFFW